MTKDKRNNLNTITNIPSVITYPLLLVMRMSVLGTVGKLILGLRASAGLWSLSSHLIKTKA